MKNLWVIKIISDHILAGVSKDFIAMLIDHEAHKVKGGYSFILHDILESKKDSEAIIEGSKFAVINLVSVLKDNLRYKTSYHSIK